MIIRSSGMKQRINQITYFVIKIKMIYYYFLESVAAHIKPIEGRLREGETLYLTCDGKGYPTPTIRWEKSSVELFSSGRMTVNNENLRITNVSLDDTGLYTCVVTNGEEQAEDDKSIQVIPKGKSKELYYAARLLEH
jgi:hypothetical protein